MFPELGSFAICLALTFTLLQSYFAFFAAKKNETAVGKLSEYALWGQFIFLSLSMGLLIVSFILNDLTVLYIRDHSHRSLPFVYKIGAAWGGHEGSLLLWCIILAGWSCLFNVFAKKQLPSVFFYKIISTLGLISCGFIIFLLFTSNPFKRDFPSALITGNDLTPILQDPGLIFHPPMLYSGYVGFVIGFAFAIASLWIGRLEQSWAKALRPWVILPWSLLSAGIVLGSWWAYRELGWGGWWFWDPVENASLLPWLSATALLHSLIVAEKRDTFKGWTLLLALVTFCLSLIGTFLVRSGVLVSVHAFANDPTRGLFLLGYLAFLMCGAFLLYSARIKYFFKASQFSLFSRETFLLINSVLLLTAVVTILLGTLYPIILDALNLGKISVGEPYFNTIFLPLFLPILLCMALAPHLHWGHSSIKKLLPHGLLLMASLIIGFITPWIFHLMFYWLTVCGIAFSIWIMLSTLYFGIVRVKWNLNYLAMIIAHLGIAVMALGITINKSYSEERQIKIFPHETATIAGYDFLFKNTEIKNGPNFQSLQIDFDITRNNKLIAPLSAEERVYVSHQDTLNKPGVLFNAWRDLYLALGSRLPDGGWSIRIYYKPFVRWIWFGGFMLLIGGILSLFSYRKVIS